MIRDDLFHLISCRVVIIVIAFVLVHLILGLCCAGGFDTALAAAR